MKRTFISIFFALMVSVLCLGISDIPDLFPAAHAEEVVSKPGVYTGYSPVLYDQDGYKLTSHYVTMPDGTKLAVDIIRPTLKGEVVETPLPVVWMHTPYNRRYYPAQQTLTTTAKLYPGAAMGLVRYGYVVAIVDARGIYSSFGNTVAYNRGEWLEPAFWDPYYITEWLAGQPWSTGKIGMWGCSATGGTQLQAAASMPPHLVTIFPMSCEGDYYGAGSGVTAGSITPAPAFPYWVTDFDPYAVPVDDDASGVMMQAAKEQHKAGVDVGYVPFRDSVSPWILEKKGLSIKWNIFSSPHIYFDDIEKSRVAMYNAGNWLDSVGLRWGPIMRFNNLKNPAKLLLGPGGHCIWYTDYSKKPYPLTFPIVTEELRWFDYWLKGINNEIMVEPPIYFFTYNTDVGKDWRFAWQYPLPNEKRLNFYLGPTFSEPGGPAGGVVNGTLTMTPSADTISKDVYTVDYTISTVADRDKKGLTYTTPPLESDLEVTGFPVLNIWVSSSVADADIFAYLEDVAPNGAVTSFTVEGSLRASNRGQHTPPYDNSGVPYHRTYAEDQAPLTPGQPVELAFTLGPTSYLFKAGHRIRLTITCADPKLTPKLDPAPTVNVYRNSVYSSYLTLPIGGAPIGAKVRIEPETLNLKSKGVLTAFVTFPETLAKGYVEDIKLETVRCNGAPVVSGKLDDGTWIFKFNRQDLTGVIGDKVDLTLEGEFGQKYDYGKLSFVGSDTIRVKK